MEYNTTMTNLFRGLSREMSLLEGDDHDHKETCTDCELVRAGEDE